MAHQIERRLPKSRYYAQDRTLSNRIERKGPLWPEYVQFLVWNFFEVLDFCRKGGRGGRLSTKNT